MATSVWKMTLNNTPESESTSTAATTHHIAHAHQSTKRQPSLHLSLSLPPFVPTQCPITAPRPYNLSLRPLASPSPELAKAPLRTRCRHRKTPGNMTHYVSVVHRAASAKGAGLHLEALVASSVEVPLQVEHGLTPPLHLPQPLYHRQDRKLLHWLRLRLWRDGLLMLICIRSKRLSLNALLGFGGRFHCRPS